MLKAVLSYPMHPEHGVVTIPFPIPEKDYDHTMELLEGIDIGDVLRQDCYVVELDSRYTILKRLEGSAVNVDELDYLAKRLDSFNESEKSQFQAMAHKLELADIKDFINLTFCCQQTTVITNFSDLEAIGRAHYMNVHGGCTVGEELANLDGCETALLLIDSGEGVVTPYGVVYDNGMKLEPLYDGRHFPSYLYKSPVMALETVSGSGAEGYFCLPMPDRQIRRMIERAGLENQSVPLRIEMDELPERAADALDLEELTLDDLPALNRLCRAIEPLKDADREKLNAIVLTAEPGDITAVCYLAENLDRFDFVPDIHTPEEYGRYMIQRSGKFAYDEDLDDFYEYRLYGERCVRKEDGHFNECGYVAYHGILTIKQLMQIASAEQCPQEPGMQMM